MYIENNVNLHIQTLKYQKRVKEQIINANFIKKIKEIFYRLLEL